MQGLHLTADLRGCPLDRAPMTDTASLRQLCLAAVAQAGLRAVGELFHRFAPAMAATVAIAPVVQATARAPAPRSGKSAITGDAAPDGGPGAEAATGITGVVLLEESHVAVHTWPELAAVTIDVYVCNFGADNAARAHLLMAALLAAFEPALVQRHSLRRGDPAGLA